MPKFTLKIDGNQEFSGNLAVSELDSSKLWCYFPHDFELKKLIGYSIWTDNDKNRDNRTRWYPKPIGNPETVATFYKDDKTTMTPAWQWFAFRQFVFACFGHFDETKLDDAELDALKKAWASAMMGKRVITNFTGWDNGYQDVILGVNSDAPYFKYMGLCMGGNLGSVRMDSAGNPGIYHPNAAFGSSYKVESLNGLHEPPDPRDVNFVTAPHLVQIATIARYDAEGTSGLSNPWSQVIPFPQLHAWNAHLPLLNITNGDYNLVSISRAYIPPVKITSRPNPYNPPQAKIVE